MVKKNALKFVIWKYLPTFAEFYKCFYEGGPLVRAPHHTNVCKISRLFGAKPSLVFDVAASTLASFLISLRALSRSVSGYSLTSMYKNLYKPWKGLMCVATFKRSRAYEYLLIDLVRDKPFPKKCKYPRRLSLYGELETLHCSFLATSLTKLT